MRDGYILLHRQGLTEQEWKHPLRTLAWIDFCTMAAYEDFTARDGVSIKRGEVIASYGFLANRWHVSKATAHEWIKHWIAERQAERRTERCTERSAERFFIVNYAKYQTYTERDAERVSERTAERSAEQMKGKQEKQNIEIKTEKIEAKASDAPRPARQTHFTFKDDNDLIAMIRKACELELLPNGRGKDNYARRLLTSLMKVFEERGMDKQAAADHVREHMPDFALMVKNARAKDAFLYKRLTTMKTIFYELPSIIAISKTVSTSIPSI